MVICSPHSRQALGPVRRTCCIRQRGQVIATFSLPEIDSDVSARLTASTFQRIGVMTVPGNWVGRSILKRMQDSDHRKIIDFVTVLMIVNFIYLAAK